MNRGINLDLSDFNPRGNNGSRKKMKEKYKSITDIIGFLQQL